MNLYTLTEEFKNISEELEDNGGDLTPELEECLKLNEANFSHIIREVFYAKKEKEDEVEMMKFRIDDWNEKMKRKKRSIDTMKTLLLKAVQVYGEQKIDEFKLAIRKSKAIDTATLDEKIARITHRCPGKKFSEILEDLDSLEMLKKENITNQYELRELAEMVEKGQIKESLGITVVKTPIKEAIESGLTVMGSRQLQNENLNIK
jgi:hypothetical protein